MAAPAAARGPDAVAAPAAPAAPAPPGGAPASARRHRADAGSVRARGSGARAAARRAAGGRLPHRLRGARGPLLARRPVRTRVRGLPARGQPGAVPRRGRHARQLRRHRAPGRGARARDASSSWVPRSVRRSRASRRSSPTGPCGACCSPDAWPRRRTRRRSWRSPARGPSCASRSPATGRCAQALEREAARLANLDTLGWVSRARLVELVDASDAFVLPSLVESFGTVALEAMARARPVVVSAGCGIADWPSLAGALVAARPGEPFADAVARLCALAPEARRALGRRAREAALALDATNAAQWHARLQRLVASGRPAPSGPTSGPPSRPAPRIAARRARACRLRRARGVPGR